MSLSKSSVFSFDGITLVFNVLRVYASVGKFNVKLAMYHLSIISTVYKSS